MWILIIYTNIFYLLKLNVFLLILFYNHIYLTLTQLSLILFSNDVDKE